MKKIEVREIRLTDFKGQSEKKIEFGHRTVVSGKNGCGKTTLADAFMWVFCDKDYSLKSNPDIRPDDGRECLPRVDIDLVIDGKPVSVAKFQKHTESKPKDGKPGKVALSNKYEINGVPKAERDFKADLKERGFDFDNFLEAGVQCFPMYHYEERKIESKTLFDDAEDTIQNNYIRRDAISDFISERCRKAYGPYVGKEDIFYYVYGILHSTEYRTSFAADLKKMLPRIPLVDEARDFWSFSKAGRTLAELHLNYENRPSATGVIVTYNTIPQSEIEKVMQSGEMETINYQVEKMRFPSKTDKSKIIIW